MTSLLEKAQREESIYTIDSISELQMLSKRPLIHVDLYDGSEESIEDEYRAKILKPTDERRNAETGHESSMSTYQ